jgi:hypothetical protein
MTEWRGDYDCYAQSLDDDYYIDYFTNTVRSKIETPLDKNGIVAHTQLAKVVLNTAPHCHYWGNRRRKHHWQWPAELYPYDRESPVNPAVFCNLPTNRENLPLSFERRLHIVTLFPAVPEMEVMVQMIEADRAAHFLFHRAREILHWQRQVRKRRAHISRDDSVLKRHNGVDIAGREVNRKKGHRYSRGFKMGMVRYSDVPPDFRPVETGGSPYQVVTDLGRVLGTKALRLAQAEPA